MFMRPLANEACALVFFSRRTDMPYRYHCSLGRLNFTGSRVYEVRALLPAGLWAALRPWLGLAHTASPKPWASGLRGRALFSARVF